MKSNLNSEKFTIPSRVVYSVTEWSTKDSDGWEQMVTLLQNNRVCLICILIGNSSAVKALINSSSEIIFFAWNDGFSKLIQ